MLVLPIGKSDGSGSIFYSIEMNRVRLQIARTLLGPGEQTDRSDLVAKEINVFEVLLMICKVLRTESCSLKKKHL